MLHGDNANGVAMIVEKNAVIADAQSKLGRFNILQSLDIAFAGTQIPVQRAQYAYCGGLVDGAKLSSGFGVPDYVLAHC